MKKLKSIKFSITFFLILIMCSACLSTKEEGASGAILLDELTSLSEKGVSLNWDDFNKYSFEDIGSGVYIRKYQIEGGHELFITGKSLKSLPEKIYIINKNGQEVSLTQDGLSVL